MTSLTDILSATKGLNEEELRALSSRILSLLNLAEPANAQETKCNCCRRCDSKQIVKYGKDKNGKQRYK